MITLGFTFYDAINAIREHDILNTYSEMIKKWLFQEEINCITIHFGYGFIRVKLTGVKAIAHSPANRAVIMKAKIRAI